jgi:PRTRC genetic system protein A
MHHVLIPGFACVVMAPVTGEPDYLQAAIDAAYPIIYIITNNGDKYVRRLQPGKNAEGKDRFVTMKIPTIPGFKVGDIKEENAFLPAGKIPFALMKSVEKFFKDVIAKFGDTNLESMIWIMWNPEQGYFLHVPNQTVAGAAVTYDWGNLPENSKIIVDIHSHANFAAFFSGTDDRDDSNTVRYSGVFGYNRRPDPEKKFRFNFMDVKKIVEIGEIFEAPTVQVEDTPSEWLDKVQVTAYIAGKGGASYPGQSRHSVHGAGGNPNGYSHPSYWDGPDPERYKAVKPSNATAVGFRGGARGWCLKGGGFVSFDDWEKEYPVALAEQKAEQAEKEAEKRRKAEEKAARKTGTSTEGGQQGTSPLELVVRETEQSLASQKEQTESRLDATSNLLPSVNENNSSSLVTRFPSTTFPSSQPSNNQTFNPSSRELPTLPVTDRDFQVGPGARQLTGQTQVTPSSRTSSSEAPSTVQSNEKSSPTTEPDPVVNKASDTSQTSDSTPKNTTSSGGLADPLGIFTELVNRPVGYVSEPQEDGTYVLKTVVMDFRGGVTQAQNEALTELEQATYQQELRDAQKALQSGSKSALLEETGKAPEGILQVEIPTAPTLVRKAVIGSSEVSPLGGGFLPAPVSAPVLQQRQTVPTVQQQAPSLIRTTHSDHGVRVTSHVGETGGARNGWTRDQWLARNRSQRSEPDYVAGESVQNWLDRRAAQIERDLGIMGAAVNPISESSIDRMHERQRQEDLLHDSEELATLQEGAAILFQKSTPSGVINILPDNVVTLRLEEGDLPASFNADCVDYGTAAAGAKALIDVAAQQIFSNGSLLRKTVQGLFEQVNEDERLPLFRTLAHSLTSKARDDLGVNGL